MNKEINLENIGILKKHKQLIVTGPPRSGTTITAIIIADILNYTFIDETVYDGNFKTFLKILDNDHVVIQNTAFTRDLHLLDYPVVLVKRKIKDILKSYEKRFADNDIPGMFNNIDEAAQQLILNHFGVESGCVPEVIYNYCDFDYVINYEDLADHNLFIKDRSGFNHIKQVAI